jgi:hypothetical protein
MGRVSTKVSASTPAALEMQQAGESDRQHEEVDQEQVEREHPHRAAQMRRIDVFHHRDLELARQQQRGEQGQEYERAPGAIGGRRVGAGETARNIRYRCRLRENVADAVVHAPDDEDADGEEGGKLDHGFDGDRRHHSLMAFGGIQMARAEEDGEGGQNHGHIQRAVLEQRHGAGAGRHDDFRVAAKDRKAVGHGLELQGDVGDHAHHRDHRDQAAEQLALAVARGDEVGDRGDAVRLGDADHLVQDESGQGEQQRRPQVDRQEADAAGRGATDAAVKGPGRAVHTERQRIHHRTGDQRASGVGSPVRVPGDTEQDAEIQEGGENDYPALQHVSRAALPLPGPSGR